MDLRQLEYFQMVCRLNNMTRAAERLHVAQPAISIAIQKLEEELGVVLFERSQKKFTLTAEGKIFLARVEDILNRTQDAMLEMYEYREMKKGLLKLGVPPMIGSFIFPHIFAGFKQIYPDIELEIFEEGSLAVRSMLERDELDLGIAIISQLSPHFSVQQVAQGEILLCVPQHHPMAELNVVGFEQLKEEPIILLKEDTYHRQVIIDECQKHGFEPQIILSSSQIETIRALVAKGVGISFLLDVIAKRNEQICCVRLREPIKIEIGLIWKKDRYLSRAAQAFINFMGTQTSVNESLTKMP